MCNSISSWLNVINFKYWGFDCEVVVQALVVGVADRVGVCVEMWCYA